MRQDAAETRTGPCGWFGLVGGGRVALEGQRARSVLVKLSPPVFMFMAPAGLEQASKWSQLRLLTLARWEAEAARAPHWCYWGEPGSRPSLPV